MTEQNLISTAALTQTRDGVAVSMRGLSRYYGSVRALDNFNLEMAPGEFVALLGPSGCGKTTALRALSGLEEVDAGTVTVDGRDLTDVPANKRNMATVFQSYSLFPHMTVAQNVDFPLSLRKQSTALRKKTVDTYLELVGLGQHHDRYASELSGGQQQRVALARALAVQPDVLLLDEPLSALDAKVRVQLRDEIRRLQLELGTTALFVTHDQSEALAVADRVGVMQSGKLSQIGAPREVYDRPTNAFVAAFVGNTNRLPAKIEAGEATVLGTRVPLLPGSVAGPDAFVLVRPERLNVEPLGANDSAASNTAAVDPRGTVVSTSFLGDYATVNVELDDATIVVAQVHARVAEALKRGDRVEIGVDKVPVLAVD
ncbi:ABC transporter ATP-binding protein [Neomicrococcus aestuarii]|nr:ABC transporter ATP-binding protein [Neomicrococcus aestuarii]